MKSSRFALLTIVALGGAVISLGLLIHHHDVGSGMVEMLCGADPEGGCEAVDKSGYSEVLGIPLAAIGMFYYLSLAFLFFVSGFSGENVRDDVVALGRLLAAAGLIVDGVLLVIQFAVIGEFCAACGATYVCTLAIFWIVSRHRRGAAAPGVAGPAALVGSDQGRLVAASWAGGAAVIAFAVWSLNSSLLAGDASSLEARLLEEKLDEFKAAPVRAIDVSRSPSTGSPDAPIRVVVYSDFLCPWCRSVAQFFQQHGPDWSDRIAVYYKFFPIDRLCNPYSRSKGHDGGCWAAIGGLCAQEQNKFWDYHDRIFRDPPRNPGPEAILKISQEAGVDTSLSGPCFASTAMQSRIRNDIEEAQRLQLTGTPRIFINGKMIPGLNLLAPALKEEASRLGLRPLEGIDEQ